jgi:stress response protein YsnF
VPPTTSGIAVRKDEEVVRLAEEQLSVGKRQVESRKTRLRRFIVVKPVEATVILHEEHAEVTRRKVADPNSARDVDWSDQVLEVTDTVEEPVIKKTIHVAEEVVVIRRSSVIRKGTDHVESVHETVRRQELDVERLPAETVNK